MIKICIDRGHYGKYNQSPINRNYYESEIVWKLGAFLAEELEEYEGVEVIHTRQDLNKDLDLISRGKKAAGCDLFISMHTNAASDPEVDYALAVVMRENDYTQIDDLSLEAGKLLADTVADCMGVKACIASKAYTGDRDGNGRNDDEWYGVLQGCKLAGVPGVILEHSFHTNKKAVSYLMKNVNLQELAEREAAALARYYGLRKKTNKEKELYRVRKAWKDAKSQKGAYTYLKNAKTCADKHPGYKVYNKAGYCVYAPKITKTDVQLAREVIAGKHGSGEDRKKSLGERYESVQKIVNEMLSS